MIRSPIPSSSPSVTWSPAVMITSSAPVTSFAFTSSPAVISTFSPDPPVTSALFPALMIKSPTPSWSPSATKFSPFTSLPAVMITSSAPVISLTVTLLSAEISTFSPDPPVTSALLPALMIRSPIPS